MEKIIKIYSGRIIVNFDEEEYKIYKLEKRSYLFYVLGFLSLVILSAAGFIYGLLNDSTVMIVSIILCLIALGFNYIFRNRIERYHRYLFDLIIFKLKMKKYKITYSNISTGHISYVKDKITHSIYVFKGKNAKSV